MAVSAGINFQRTLGSLRAHADIRQRHRHQQQRGKDQHRDTDAGGDRQILDHRNVDQHQHGKPDSIRQQRSDAGDEQAAKGIARGDQFVRAPGDVLHDAVHFLRGVGYADGKDQKRHQHRVWIDGITQPRDKAQLPDHCDQRATHHQQSTAHTPGVEINDEQRCDHRQREEHHHLNQAIDQVAHQLGKADYAHFVRAIALLAGLTRGAVTGEFDLVAQLLFQHLREVTVVDWLSTGASLVQQRHHEHARLQITRHQTADDAGAGDVLAQLLDLLGGALIGVGHHRAALKAFFGDLRPAYRRAPQRLHPGAVDACREEQLIVDLFEHVQIGRIENIAPGVLHHNPHRVAKTTQRLPILEVILNVRLTLRDHFFEARFQLQTGDGHVTEHHGDHGHQQHEQRAKIEHHALQPTAGVALKITYITDHRHAVLFDIAHIRVLAFRVVFLFFAQCRSTTGTNDQHRAIGRLCCAGHR